MSTVIDRPTEAGTYTLALPLTDDIIRGFAAIIPHLSTDKMSPSITAARIDRRTLVGTDVPRQVVGRICSR